MSRRSELSERRRRAARARALVQESLRGLFATWGFEEVETPSLVPAPGMEPAIRAFEARFVPETPEGRARSLYLHTSPEYAMKRLLAEGYERIFQLARVYRNGEIAQLHNPEFTMLEFYRAHADYGDIMRDTEALVRCSAKALGRESVALSDGREVPLAGPFERLTVREAFRSRLGVDLEQEPTVEALYAAADARGLYVPRAPEGAGARSFEDLFFQLFLSAIEPTLGFERPTFLIEYPASMASLARLKPGEPRVAERVELYLGGVELANGFSELTDAGEQRRRLQLEQEQRGQEGREVYPLDEHFLEAVGRLPPCAGIALGFDRLLMMLLGARNIGEVLLFPASEFFE